MSRTRRANGATRIARAYNMEAVASLVSILRSERSPAAARASAATKLLELGAERVEAVRVIDLSLLDDNEKDDLMEELLAERGVTPAAFEAGMRLLVRATELQLALK